eukprot:EG_transcript_7056
MYHLQVITTWLNDVSFSYIFDDVQSDTVDPELQARTREAVRNLVEQMIRRDGLLVCCRLWISLCLAGFNGATLLAYAAVFVANVGGISTNPLLSEKHIALICHAIATLWCIWVSLVVERLRRLDFLTQAQLAQELQASQLADNVLNHTLKNALADVAADIEVFLAGDVGMDVLRDAVACLRRGIQSCRARSVYLKMVAGEYVPVNNAINLAEFGQQLVAGRSVQTRLVHRTVLMDATLLELILENALSNAFRHGHPDHPDVTLTIQAEPSLRGCQVLSFIITNVAHPHRPILTDELARTLLAGEARGPPAAVTPTLSDGLGLQHCRMAARLGGIALALRQAAGVVAFTATLDVGVPPGSAGPPVEDEFLGLAEQCPAGLCIFCLDDSAAARRLLELQLKCGCPAATVRTFGSAEQDIDLFVTEALRHADIVVVDQNLQYALTYYGTDVCRKLVGHTKDWPPKTHLERLFPGGQLSRE